MDFTVYAAIHEETDKGWVWLLDKRFKSRTTIKITRGDRSIYCEYRELDDAFLTIYNERLRAIVIDPEGTYSKGSFYHIIDPDKYADIIVMSEWYRRALGGFDTTHKSGSRVGMVIEMPRQHLWADLKASCQHPEPVVRLGTRLGIIGVVLGLAGAIFAVRPPNTPEVIGVEIVLILGLIFAGIFAATGL